MKKLKNKKKANASMTLEASLILPLFILLFMNLLSIIEVYRIHASVTASLWERGRQAAVGVYVQRQGEEYIRVSEALGRGELQEFLLSSTATATVLKNLKTYPVWEKIVTRGRSGFFISTSVEGNGLIQIGCSYRIHPLFSFLTPITRDLKNWYYGHTWEGYIHSRTPGGEKEAYVYVTESGTVYHKNRGCSYLNPSIQQVQEAELEALRNRNGSIYYACPLCDGDGGAGERYITDYGTNYHTKISCSGLKRTIYEVKWSEVGERGACSRCGG